MTRTFTDKEFHLIYDSGAVKTTATILSFETRPDPLPILKGSSSKSKKPRIPNNSTYVDVISSDSEVDLGGVDIDLVLRELMIEDFEGGKGKGLNVRDDARAMRRLWKEAGRVKSVLSANQEVTVNVSDRLSFSTRFLCVLMRFFFFFLDSGSGDRLNHSPTILTIDQDLLELSLKKHQRVSKTDLDLL